MMRMVIVTIFVVMLITWTAIYLLPAGRDAVLSSQHMQSAMRAVHAMRGAP